MTTKRTAPPRTITLVSDGFLTYLQSAAWLACSRRTVCDLIARGELPAVSIGRPGSKRPRRVIPLAALREYAAGLLDDAGRNESAL